MEINTATKETTEQKVERLLRFIRNDLEDYIRDFYEKEEFKNLDRIVIKIIFGKSKDWHSFEVVGEEKYSKL